METVSSLAAELPRRVTAFYAGDELYAGQWLTNFQRAEGAWEVCIEALRPGPLPTCDEELMQEFCAQTLGRLARSFGSRHVAGAQQTQRDKLAALLAAHAGGQRTVWKQLALALTCADLWLGMWAPPARGTGELPRQVRRELLSLPVDLLFCDRALPLDDPRLRQAAAASLVTSCGEVFEELLQVDGSEGASLHILASWLSALRKALRMLPTHDESAPLQALAMQGDQLVALVRSKPAEAAEIARQLARWQHTGCDEDLAVMLGPLLECIFNAAAPGDCQALLPLLEDLAAGCWPRATLGDFALDWQAIQTSALAVLRVSVEKCGASTDEDIGDQVADAQAAFAVWHTFAVTVREGTRARCPVVPEKLPHSGMEVAMEGESRPEKRSRVREEEQWSAPPERIAQCEALPQLFNAFASTVVELLRLPADALNLDALHALQDLRASAEEAFSSWAILVGDSSAWQDAAHTPLQQTCVRFASDRQQREAGLDGELLQDDVWGDVEGVLWFTAALARSRPLDAAGAAGAPPAAAAILELDGSLDCAPEPWRTWVWAAAAGLAATSPAAYAPRMIEWLLQRPPWATCIPEFLELTELPYAEALEQLCRQLPAGTAHVAVGERLAVLAFTERPAAALHENTVCAQGLMLRAMRNAMGCDAGLLCGGLAERVLPVLSQAADAEAEAARTETAPAWRAAQVLFATLVAALPPAEAPSADPMHPAFLLWRKQWRFVEAALLHWPQSKDTDQPAAAAAEAVTTAVAALPGLLPEALPLLARSAAQQELPQVQLQALRTVANGVRCPPVDATQGASLLATTIAGITEALLVQQKALLQSPPTLAALFGLLADAIRPSPAGTTGAGLCNDQLRPLLVGQSSLVGRCLDLVPQGLPDCTSSDAAVAMLRFMVAVVGAGEELAPDAPHRPVLVAKLPELCAALCQAFASVQHLAELDEGLFAAAEFLLRAANALPTDFGEALTAGMCHVQVAPWSSLRLQRHIAKRAEWPKKGDWLEELQHIVCEWQREHSKVSH